MPISKFLTTGMFFKHLLKVFEEDSQAIPDVQTISIR